jgi:signal transduction histidine kinase
MQRTVDRELSRARTAARAADARADPALVADRLIAVLQRTPDGARLHWQQTIPSGRLVAIDEADLAEAMGALAENAARHARSKVVISAEMVRGRLQIAITDDGAGIPQAERELLKRRHARADETGTGLGLAIALELAQAAGGSLSLEDAAPGLTVLLTLPFARQFHRKSLGTLV